MNNYEKLMRYIVSEALRVMVGEISATGGANTGGGSTFAVTPGEGYVTPNAFRGKKRKAKKEAIKEADDTPYPKDVRSLGTHAPAPGQVPTGYSGDIEAMKRNLGITPQTKVISTKRGGRDNPYALAHYLAKKGIAPTHTPIPAHEPQQALPGELDRQATIDREARLRAQAAERGQLDPTTGKLRRGRPAKKVPPMPTGTAEGAIEEKAPPGMEDTVMALKKKFPKDQAFKIAWSMYNKKNEAKDGKASIKVKTSDTEHLPTVVVYGQADVEDGSDAVVKAESAETDMDFADRILKRASQQAKPKPEPKKTNEVAPKGWSGTVKAMKKHKDIENPWALAHYMKKKGATPRHAEEAAQPSFGLNTKGENDVVGGGSAVGGMQAKVGSLNGKKVNELSPDLLHKAAGMRGAQGQAAHKIAKQLNKGQKGAAADSDYSTGKFVGHHDVPNAFFKKATKLRQHAYDKTEKNEVAPEGWEDTVKAMKKHKDIENPWALAHYMKGKGYKSHK